MTNWREELTRPSFLTAALAIIGLGAAACSYLGAML